MSLDQQSATNVIAKALRGATLAGIEAWEHGWAFRFSSGATVSTQSIWRVLNDRGLMVTSEDHQQQFGLARPVNAGERATATLLGSVSSVDLVPISSDLRIGFGSAVLEFLNTSAGYEGWHFVGRSGDDLRSEVVALGGGGLAIW